MIKAKGFTLVESLVAVSMLVLAIIGATQVSQTTLSSYIFSKDQVIAFYLAQEGFEQVRNIRDANNLKGQNWLTGIAAQAGDPCFPGKACTVDPVFSSEAINCPSGPDHCPNLRQDPVTGFYGYNAPWTETVFRREIRVSTVNSNEVSITVTVDWSKGVVARQFRARENLLNW